MSGYRDSEERPSRNSVRLTILSLAAASLCLIAAGSTAAQNPPIHYRYRGHAPPGVIGQAQLSRGGPLQGYFQPVQIKAPPESMISFAVGGNFTSPVKAPVTVGMLIGQVYRLKVTQIPNQPGMEVFPTLELINRLYPLQSRKAQFPIPVDLTGEELRFALEGKYVTRVIYLENPETAFPAKEDAERQRYFEARPGDDPLFVADILGRPMAILRMGGRIPNAGGPDDAFLFYSPQMENYSLSDFNDGSAVPRGNALRTRWSNPTTLSTTRFR